jgi:hypothetical protein
MLKTSQVSGEHNSDGDRHGAGGVKDTHDPGSDRGHSDDEAGDSDLLAGLKDVDTAVTKSSSFGDKRQRERVRQSLMWQTVESERQNGRE